MEKFFIPSGNKKISGVIHESGNETKKLAILCPGYLDSKDYAHLVGLADDLAKQGYTVVRFDPTGVWESEGEISDHTVTNYLQDIQSVLEYMLAKRTYDQILIGGHSRGGQVSLHYAAKDKRISSVLTIMPSSGTTKVEGWKNKGVRVSSRDIPGSGGTKEFIVPYSYVVDMDRYNVFEDVKRINVPVIFVAGELDDVVSPESVKSIFDSANEPKKFILLKGIGHGYRRSASEVKKVNEIIIEQLVSLK